MPVTGFVNVYGIRNVFWDWIAGKYSLHAAAQGENISAGTETQTLKTI